MPQGTTDKCISHLKFVFSGLCVCECRLFFCSILCKCVETMKCTHFTYKYIKWYIFTESQQSTEKSAVDATKSIFLIQQFYHCHEFQHVFCCCFCVMHSLCIPCCILPAFVALFTKIYYAYMNIHFAASLFTSAIYSKSLNFKWCAAFVADLSSQCLPKCSKLCVVWSVDSDIFEREFKFLYQQFFGVKIVLPQTKRENNSNNKRFDCNIRQLSSNNKWNFQ